MALPDDLERATLAWIEGDPDPATRGELEALLAAGDEAELTERMGETLRFGTAGIRGVVEAGSGRMNRAVVIRTTRGLADYLQATRPGAGPVVVGYDGRHSSRQFAADTVGVLAAAGFEVRYFTGVVPTPVVSFSARVLGASAAVVITASHNPPRDNGYKVYDANSAQIIPPVDHDIAAAIDRVGPAVAVPRTAIALEGGNDLAAPVDADIYDRYVEEVLALRPEVPVDRNLRIVYTPMHGVGRDTLERVFAAAGYADLRTVPAQADPDGDFPTVAFPNPEEDGALDLALTLAAEADADVILANDPDADRLAVALPGGGDWVMLTGNQIGILLADFLLEHDRGPGTPLVLNSIVSSPMLASVAAAHGARFEPTLTGFKWISNAAMDLEAGGEYRFVFGYEEALGYTVGPVVRDKDGISAALVFAELMAAEKVAGRTVFDRIADLFHRHGVWVSTQKSIVRPGSEGAAEIAGAMALLAERTPELLGGIPVAGIADYREGAGDRPRWLAATPLVEFDLGTAGRALVRPSGTEPKLKIYVDLRGEAGDDLAAAEGEALERAALIADDLAGFLGFG